jgi:hypothetical protein
MFSFRIAGGIGAVVVAAIILIFAYTDLETSGSVFSNYEDAAKNDAVGPGKWLPSWLPKSANDIHEAHSIDTNQVWLEFKDVNSLRDLGQKCQPMDRRSARAALPNLGTGFPRSMRKSREQLSKATEIDAVHCEDADVKREWIAVQRSGSDLVYAWTLHQPA